jgi:hypothetical protein
MTTEKMLVAAAVTGLCLLICCAGGEADRVIEILDAESHLDISDLWPGFAPLEIPVAVFDGDRTILARHPAPPVEFEPLPGHPGVLIYEGRHPVMTACTTGEIAGVRTALVTLDPEDHTPVDESAAVLVHESFHVYAGSRHRDWGANEAQAFLYPVEDTLGLALRRLEEDALRQALATGDDEDAGRWAAAALEIRNTRSARLAAPHMGYERGIELMEGTAFYVENRALGDAAKAPLSRGAYGVEDIRRRAYDTGRALCVLLDRFAPEWKPRLEEGPAVPLDSLLLEALGDRGVVPHDVAEDVVAEETARAREDIAALLESRKVEAREFLGAEGWTLEIVADGAEGAFTSVTFDPMNLKLVGEDEILHRRMLKLAGPSGTFEAMDRSVLTQAAGDHPLFSGIRRVVAAGLEDEPAVREENGETIITADGITASVSAEAVDRQGRVVTVRLR